MVAAVEPGWYDDGTGAMRWWDGSRWTEHFVDFGSGAELRTSATPVSPPTAAGWYDDGRGRMRRWDGRGWTAESRFSGGEESYAGIVVDGRWIHLGEQSQPIVGVVAIVDSLERIGKRPDFTRAAHAKALFGPRGRLTWRQFGRFDRRALGLAIESADQAWISFPPPGDEARARSSPAGSPQAPSTTATGDGWCAQGRLLSTISAQKWTPRRESNSDTGPDDCVDSLENRGITRKLSRVGSR